MIRGLTFIASLAFFSLGHATHTGKTDNLFLELDIDAVGNGTAGSWIRSPWGISYASAMHEGRYGDAIWARYHMDGRATGNIIAADNTTVTEEVLDDAMGYRVGNPDHFAEVAKKYNGTSRYDVHRELVDIVMDVLQEDISSLQKRVTYNIKCSKSNLALRSECYQALELMDKWTIAIGDIRTLDFYEDCYIRVGEYGSGADLTWNKAHAVGVLIYEDCQRSRACCDYLWVSGYSPKNDGHRKVCLSSKSTGCKP